MTKNVLYTDEKLTTGQSLVNGDYRLTMQADANLVLYDLEKAVWASNTNGATSSNCYLVLQTDGNLVIYTSDSNKAIWSSKTNGKGNGNYVLVLQDDRNLVIYTDPTWATGTNK